jgi:plasmid stabilization system protein ParE
MNDRVILFSPNAKQRLEDVADYLYRQSLSNEFVRNYLQQFQVWLETVLGQFPESGVVMPEYGEGVRKVVYREYSFIYRYTGSVIEILTVYRENMP